MKIGDTQCKNIIESLIPSLKPAFQSTVHVDYPTVRTMINDYVAFQLIDIRTVYININNG